MIFCYVLFPMIFSAFIEKAFGGSMPLSYIVVPNGQV